LDTWLTTQTSVLDSGFTETGPNPTGISYSNAGVAGVLTSNTDNELFAVLTANKRVPSAERRTGLVCPSSKFAYVDCAHVVLGITMTPSITSATLIDDRLVNDLILPPLIVTGQPRWTAPGGFCGASKEFAEF
jgi:hypothetical protein